MLLVSLFVLAAAAPPPIDAQEAGRALTASFYKGEVVIVWARFSPRMQKVLGSLDALRAFQAKVAAEAGTEQEVLDERVEERDGLHVYTRLARFSKASVAVQWGIADTGLVEGFVVRPLPPKAVPAAAGDMKDYVTKTPLRLPFAGAWYVVWDGHTLAGNHHIAVAAQRFAYDFLQKKDGATHAGAGKRNEDYLCFDREILAPGAGVVRHVEDGVEDNVPGTMNPQQAYGNHVVLDHGNGEISVLCHFRKGTVVVKEGQKVSAGAVLGRCGNSGNSSEPHLHYHLQEAGDAGRGLPARFLSYFADGKPVEAGEPTKGQTIEVAPR